MLTFTSILLRLVTLSHKRNLFCLPRQERFFLAFRAKYRANKRKTGFGAVDRLLRSPVFCVQQQKYTEIAVVQIEFLCFASNYEMCFIQISLYQSRSSPKRNGPAFWEERSFRKKKGKLQLLQLVKHGIQDIFGKTQHGARAWNVMSYACFIPVHQFHLDCVPHINISRAAVHSGGTRKAVSPRTYIGILGPGLNRDPQVFHFFP